MNAPVRKITAARAIAGAVHDAKPFNWSRGLKLMSAIGLIGIGGYAVFSNTASIATSNAVVTAYGTTLRTPIEGGLSGAGLRVGQPVSQGQMLASVSNKLVDARALSDMEVQLQKARANSAAISSQIEQLDTMRRDLLARSAQYVTATLARLDGSELETRNLLAAAVLKRDLAETTLKRRRSLSVTGYTSAADLDKSQSEFDIAARETDARTGTLKTIEAKIAAARLGIVADENSSDSAYSKQRADEISIRLSELRREQATTRAEVDQAQLNVAREKARVAELATSVLVSPQSGIIWKLNASDGERISAGESVAQVVDCNAAFLMASVPQDRVPEIEIGNEVEYRLSGDGQKHLGRVVSVAGDESESERNLVAAPFVTRGAPAAIVRIAVESDGSQCLVGRTARVVITSSGSVLSRFFGLAR